MRCKRWNDQGSRCGFGVVEKYQGVICVSMQMVVVYKEWVWYLKMHMALWFTMQKQECGSTEIDLLCFAPPYLYPLYPRMCPLAITNADYRVEWYKTTKAIRLLFKPLKVARLRAAVLNYIPDRWPDQLDQYYLYSLHSCYVWSHHIRVLLKRKLHSS